MVDFWSVGRLVRNSIKNLWWVDWDVWKIINGCCSKVLGKIWKIDRINWWNNSDVLWRSRFGSVDCFGYWRVCFVRKLIGIDWVCGNIGCWLVECRFYWVSEKINCCIGWCIRGFGWFFFCVFCGVCCVSMGLNDWKLIYLERRLSLIEFYVCGLDWWGFMFLVVCFVYWM